MLAFILLQAAPGGLMSGLSALFPLLIFLVFMIFFVFIPQNRQRKQQADLMKNLKEGMDVVTQSGIIGRITKVDGDVVRLMVDEKTFIRVLKSSVTGEYKG